jgi:hypothetical protein
MIHYFGMKKIGIFCLLMISSKTMHAQYFGPMDLENFNRLDTVEQRLFTKCLNQLSLDINAMDWIQIGDSIYENIRMDDGVNYYYNKKTIVSYSDGTFKTIENHGPHSLDKPKFFAVIRKENEISKVTLMMYY